MFILWVATHIPLEINDEANSSNYANPIAGAKLSSYINVQLASKWREDLMTEIFFSFKEQTFPEWAGQVEVHAAHYPGALWNLLVK